MWRCDPQEIEDLVKQSSQSPSVWVVKHPPFLTTPHEKMRGKANMSYPKNIGHLLCILITINVLL